MIGKRYVSPEYEGGMEVRWIRDTDSIEEVKSGI